MLLSFMPATIEKLRGILQPKRERYDLTYTMNRWAEIVFREETAEPPKDENGEPIEIDARLVLNIPPDAPPPVEDNTSAAGRGRPRIVDKERWAALALAVIFYEYTKTKPTRIGKNKYKGIKGDVKKDRDKSSPFYQFAEFAFKAIRLEPSEDAFREATMADWNTPHRKRQRKDKPKRQAPEVWKRAIRKLLWGALPSKTGAAPDFAWQEKHLRPRKNSPPDMGL